MNCSWSRTDIADYLGLTIETVCRVLTRVKEDGVISMLKGAARIALCNRSGLLSIVQIYGGKPTSRPLAHKSMPSKLSRKALETVVAELRRRGVSEEQITKMRVTACPPRSPLPRKKALIKGREGSGGEGA